ncbi:hypothetical protein D3C71_1492620 [compost metagenome]
MEPKSYIDIDFFSSLKDVIKNLHQINENTKSLECFFTEKNIQTYVCPINTDLMLDLWMRC